MTMQALTSDTQKHVLTRDSSGKLFDEHGKRRWQAGSLVYDRAGLFKIAFWLFFGQFTFTLELVAIPTLLPLLLNNKGFSGQNIGTLLSILPIGSLLLIPVLGTWSDNLRTPWGRRRPISILMAPLWLAGLIWVAIADSFSSTTAAMILIGFAGTGGTLLNPFYNEVIPPELMGRFMGAFRFLGSIGVLTFQFVAMRFFDKYPMATFIILALIGFTGQMSMLIMIKEGNCDSRLHKRSIIEHITNFTREGFTNKYIIFLWLTMGVTALGGPAIANYFNVFAQKQLLMSSTELGNLLGFGTVIGLCLILPVGWVLDEVGPKKMWIWGGFLVGFVQILMIFFVSSKSGIYVLYLLFAAFNTLLTASLLPIMYCFIPKEKFGQLSGANSIVTSILQILGTTGCGFIVGLSQDDYRYVFIFGGIAYVLTPVFMWLLLKQDYPYHGYATTMHPDGRRGKAAEQPKEVGA